MNAANSRPPYPAGIVVGPCVCGSWPGGECLKCKWIPAPTKAAHEDLTAVAEQCGAERRYPPYPGPDDFRWSMSATQLRAFVSKAGCPIALEALELVAMQPATRGVYLLDQQDMDFVKKAVKALKGQA